MANEYLEQAVYQGLKNISGDIGVLSANIWNENPKQDPDYPMIVFEVIDEEQFGRSHDAGVAAHDEARVQIDIYATSKHEAATIQEKLKAKWEHFVGSFSVAGFTSVSVRFANRNPGGTYQDEATLKTVTKRSLDFFVQY